MSEFLDEMIAAVERIKRDYPDVPVRFEFAPNVYSALEVACHKERHDFISNVLTVPFWTSGIPCMIDPRSGPGEWGPVFRCRPR